jgi:two-component system, LytTR family, response regulator
MVRAILVDDEENALNALKQKILQHCDAVEILAACHLPEEAIEKINELQPDILFLDIEMPGMNGFSLLQKLTHKNVEVVFVTAYDHYAIKAIRYSALDYLVKPVDTDDLKSAVDRAVQKANSTLPNERLELLLDHLEKPQKNLSRIAIPIHDGIQFIKVNDIIYLEAHANYTHVFATANMKYIVSRTIRDLEEILPPEIFVRIHNSHIININYLEKYIRGEGGQVVLSNGIVLDVAKRKKAEFLKGYRL